jgi:hypothetical protein
MRKRGRVDERLRERLIDVLCDVIDGWDQSSAAAMLGNGITQPDVSRLRRGDAGYSIGRLIRLIASQGYDIELHLKYMPRRRFAKPPEPPMVAVIRYGPHNIPILEARE